MSAQTFVKRHGAASSTDAERWEEGDVSRTLTSSDAGREGSPPALVLEQEQFVAPVHPTLTKVAQTFEMLDGGLVEQGPTPFAGSPRDGYAEADTAATLMASAGKSGSAKIGTRNQAEVLIADTFNHTQQRDGLALTLKKGSDSTAVQADLPDADRCSFDPAPDGRRYGACGDGVAAPHAHWIGLRLLAVMDGRDPDA